MGNVTIVTWRRDTLLPVASSTAILELFSGPGEWTEEDYYFLDGRGRLVELVDGDIVVQPRPTSTHHLVLGRLVSSLFELQHLGAVGLAPLPMRLWPGRIRQPDLGFMLREHSGRIGKYWGVPDLAIEVTTAETRDQDRGIKRADYERAGVQEYWIIDPEAQTAEVIRFGDESCSLGLDSTLTSPMFPGWSLPLRTLFAPQR